MADNTISNFDFSLKLFTFRICLVVKLVAWICLLPVFISPPSFTGLVLGSVHYNDSLPDGSLVQQQVDIGTWSFCARQQSVSSANLCDNVTPCLQGSPNHLCSRSRFGYTLQIGNTSESNGRNVRISTKGVAIARTFCFALLTGSLFGNAFGFESGVTSVMLLALTIAGAATPPIALHPLKKIGAEVDLSITGLMLGIVSCLLVAGCASISIGTLSWRFKRYSSKPKPPLRPIHWAKYSLCIRHVSTSEDPYAHYWAALDEARRKEDKCHQCAMCWETNEKLVALSCHHFFCSGCMKEGLRVSDDVCPICATQLHTWRQPLGVICK